MSNIRIEIPFTLYIFSLEIFSRSFEVIFFSTASTIPSFASIPTQIPACEMASIAYSTCYKRVIFD